MPASEIPLKGAHNLENVLAAVCVGMIAGCEPRRIAGAVRGFRAVEHRLEHVATIQGVEYYNDSKATNVDATIKALESFHNVHIILGGKDKGSDYSVLIPLLRERAKCVYTIGAAAEKIESQIAGASEIVPAGTLEVAVKKAMAAAVPRGRCSARSRLRQLRPVRKFRASRAPLQGTGGFPGFQSGECGLKGGP